MKNVPEDQSDLDYAFKLIDVVELRVANKK